MHGADFAADPHGAYDEMRALGKPAAPVELAPGVEATLVVDYQTARAVLQNTQDFSRDPRRWKALNEGKIPLDSPVLPMMMHRPNAMFSDGAVHLRLRKNITDSLDKLNAGRIRRDVKDIALFLIDQFSERGSADLLNDYAKPLPALVFNRLVGCPADIGDRLASSMSALLDGTDAQKASEEISSCLMELITLKRREPGEDVTSWLIQHPAGLSDEELNYQLFLLMGAGLEPEAALISNPLLLLLSGATSGRGSSMLPEEAVDHVLWNNPPIANYATHYPVRDVDLGGVQVEAGTPVVISFGGANTDPVLRTARQSLSKGAHLAWGAGPHACPAKLPAQVIALTAIETILNELPDLALAVPAEELQWRPGPFHRAVAAMPIRFTPSPGTRTASLHTPTDDARSTTAEPSRVPTAPHSHQEAKPSKKGFWSSFLDIFRV
ncbi:cytochrome P450 [Streptomyces sp. NPDC004230]